MSTWSLICVLSFIRVAFRQRLSGRKSVVQLVSVPGKCRWVPQFSFISQTEPNFPHSFALFPLSPIPVFFPYTPGMVSGTLSSVHEIPSCPLFFFFCDFFVNFFVFLFIYFRTKDKRPANHDSNYNNNTKVPPARPPISSRPSSGLSPTPSAQWGLLNPVHPTPEGQV